jgi:hypothetical protein
LRMHVDLSSVFFPSFEKRYRMCAFNKLLCMCFMKLFRPQNFVLSSYILKIERYHLC